MKHSIFWMIICLAAVSGISYATQHEKSNFSYTGIPDIYVELNEIHLVDVNRVKYSVYVNENFGLSKVAISSNKGLVEVKGRCFKDVHFPDLQSLKVSKRVAQGSSEVDATTFKMDFHYFGDKNDALSENVEFQDWSIKLLVTNDLSAKIEVKGSTRKVSIECEVSTTR
ncbi:hypothetical protein [Pseudoalteromonas luteoviolacea]|uniref:Auto-transporter adhesin head GIN domain-containing protein n=1 Tax=Pseudoalteromonas luteoviolacea (strain 2ta16) TaxID=1353533 RepID=V4HTW0_PSEL2|nr:hypothetical protein [Pseudoalteromonas luteoviolacea]ESP94270.1 hypothetical protein PL2TA16_01948 [Pseudoalteromonas luteoviolacea 2ta16]KZN33288.1 hypothetical protein N483_26315 [Pseudoalteromonas luteoviolacea NCIMB 1944]